MRVSLYKKGRRAWVPKGPGLLVLPPLLVLGLSITFRSILVSGLRYGALELVERLFDVSI